jgi:hypothetical protein
MSLWSTALRPILDDILERCAHSFRIDADKNRLLNSYLSGGFEKLLPEFGVPAQSRTLPQLDIKGPGTTRGEQMKALFKLGARK